MKDIEKVRTGRNALSLVTFFLAILMLALIFLTNACASEPANKVENEKDREVILTAGQRYLSINIENAKSQIREGLNPDIIYIEVSTLLNNGFIFSSQAAELDQTLLDDYVKVEIQDLDNSVFSYSIYAGDDLPPEQDSIFEAPRRG
ncbi:MAG: hypothetical protein GX763_03285 [Clostridiaceae bacterium]|nr:hypothetical protein [Clostridiaceae bacterium]